MLQVDNHRIKRQLEAFMHSLGPRGVAAGVCLLFAGVGTMLLSMSSAATSTASLQPEAGTKTAKVQTLADATASGGQKVQFGAAGGFQANCISKPSACGYPDETNTGVPSGVNLTPSGSITITQNGTVIHGLNITGEVVVRANNVTIRNTRITSGDYYPIRYFDNNNTGLLVEDSEIIGTNSNVTSSVAFNDYTLRRVNIHGGADGLKTDGNVVVEDSYIHDLSVGADTHNDGFQATGGSNVTLRHNTCKLSTTNGANACLQMGNENGTSTNWLVTDNLFDGGGWTINTGGANSTSIVFSNNRFTRNYGYGPASTGTVTWTGNYYDDTGAAANN